MFNSGVERFGDFEGQDARCASCPSFVACRAPVPTSQGTRQRWALCQLVLPRPASILFGALHPDTGTSMAPNPIVEASHSTPASCAAFRALARLLARSAVRELSPSTGSPNAPSEAPGSGWVLSTRTDTST